MRTIALIALVAAALTSVGFAQAPAETSPEKAAVIANDRLYEAAYASADVEALVDFFAEDADYTTEDGRTFSGRAEIEAAIRAGLTANRGSELAINAETIRVLGPESVLEKGSTTVKAKDGETSGALYTAIHVKKNGEWKINQLIESPLPALMPRDRLAELAWLVGDWEETDKTDDLSIRSVYEWARGGNFLTRSVTVERAGNVTLEGWQIIGWDPIEERIRSWTFDSEGGFAEGYFTREGSRWLLRETGVAPDGSRTGADNTITKISEDRFTWESNNRTLDGDPQPGIGRIEINLQKNRDERWNNLENAREDRPAWRDQNRED
jgi:uncharacterized protein (TIGR02246 family)